MEEQQQELIEGQEPVEREFLPETQPLVAVAPEVEVDSAQVRRRVIELKNDIGVNYTELCQLLHTIQKKGLYESWGYRTFREYASKELEFKATKAMYLAQIWKNLRENQEPSVFEKVMPLGWSKAKELARVVTKENVDAWVEKARHLGVDALIKEVRTEISRKIPDDPKDALDKEEEVRDTPVENERKHISLTFDYEDYLTLMQATDHLQTEYPGLTIPKVVAHACRELLGSIPGETGLRAAIEHMSRLGSLHEKNVVVIDRESGAIDHGQEHLEAVLKEALTPKTEEDEAPVPEAKNGNGRTQDTLFEDIFHE